MAQGLSRRRYAALWGVSETAIRKAIARGLVFLHEDGTVDAELSDEVWGRRYELRTGAAELDPATAARLDAEFAESWAWTERVLAEILGSPPPE